MANLSDIAIKGFDSLLSVKQEMEDADKKERERRHISSVPLKKHCSGVKATQMIH